ncbi:5-formyltetrahydrofolate cyclo-ligase [Niallia taxi]|uniref:5-formyltetrahydrofolate cyclo-ligase n=1 Tax=Niallia taxi TaxID=2499688 RepID=UPI00119E7DA5
MTESKQEIRSRVLAELRAIPKPAYEQLSYEIAQNLYNHPLFQKASHVGVTISRFPEVDTYQIIRAAWAQGKKVSVPKCLPKTRAMEFRILERFDQLESIYSGLYEPMEAETKLTEANEIELLLVPGVAYSKDGYRIGFGGGYYDRFLKSFHGTTISLAIESQLEKSLPIESHDIPVQHIITNKGAMVVGAND